jgi:hypothetical protein
LVSLLKQFPNINVANLEFDFNLVEDK